MTDTGGKDVNPSDTHAESGESDKARKELQKANFDLITHEMERQYDKTWDSNNTLQEKAGILLGFIILVFVQIGLTDIFTSINLSLWGLHILIIGIISLSVSFVIGVILFDVRQHPIGPELSDLLENYRNDNEINYQHQIYGRIYDSFKD